jgi:hypothetical protein
VGDIFVEVVPPPGQAGDLSPADLLERASSRVEELGRALASLAGDLRGTLDRQLSEQSDSVWPLTSLSLQLSLNLEAEAGIIVSRARTGAAFQATLTWTRQDSSAPAGGAAQESGG